jgi:hypothetical protein
MYICSQISNILHNHSFSNIIFEIGFNLHYTCLKSCVGLAVDTWFFICLVIPFICLILFLIYIYIYYYYFWCTRLGLLIFELVQCICA